MIRSYSRMWWTKPSTPVLLAARKTMVVPSMRRTANPNAVALTRSTHCTLSTIKSSGPSAARSSSRASRAVEQGEQGRRGDQRVRRGSRREAEDVVEGVALAVGEPAGPLTQRVEQPMQRREVHPGLELHTGGAQYTPADCCGPLLCGIQQRALPHPRVATQQHAGAGPVLPCE
nr:MULTISPECIES: hypothetical protein [Streptomyces]